MSSISVKLVKWLKSFGVTIRLAPLALPALLLPLSAARWQPRLDTGEVSGAVFHPETAIAHSAGERGKAPEITAVSEGARPGLPADTASPGEIARAFYRAARENAGNARVSGPPFSEKNTGLPDSISGPAAEPAGGNGRTEGEGWRLLGFIRDLEGVERRYFKEKESGKIITVTSAPENFPASADSDSEEGDNR